MYYDANKKRNVDFILQRDFKNPVPIEVGRGRKDKKQITHAINSYGADYGIIISDTTTNIEKHDNIIYVPQKHFHFYNWLCSKIHRFLMKLLLKDLSFLLK